MPSKFLFIAIKIHYNVFKYLSVVIFFAIAITHDGKLKNSNAQECFRIRKWFFIGRHE